jgi:hypothetical protein
VRFDGDKNELLINLINIFGGEINGGFEYVIN